MMFVHEKETMLSILLSEDFWRAAALIFCHVIGTFPVTLVYDYVVLCLILRKVYLITFPLSFSLTYHFLHAFARLFNLFFCVSSLFELQSIG